MKILVPVKRVVDFTVKVHANAEQTAVDIAHVKMSLNPFDEIALEEAVRLKEQNIASEVIAVSCGTAQSQEVLRSALALGADRAMLLQTDVELQPLAVAKLLAEVCRQQQPDLVLMGKQAIDGDAGQTGQMLAALLDWPQATFVSKLQWQEASIQVQREVDGGVEVLDLSLPAVITADLRLNEPRYITLPNLMKAKRKPIETVPAEDLVSDLQPHLTITKVYEPPQREQGEMVADVATLVAKLKHEAKVI